MLTEPMKALAKNGDRRFPPDSQEVVEDHVEPFTSREVHEKNVDRGGGALEATADRLPGALTRLRHFPHLRASSAGD